MSPLHSLAHRERRELANRKTLIMLLAAAVIATYALWRYLVGDFEHILTPVLATLLMAIAAGLNHLDDEQPLPSYLTLIASYLMLALEAPGTYPGMSLWLGLPSVVRRAPASRSMWMDAVPASAVPPGAATVLRSRESSVWGASVGGVKRGVRVRGRRSWKRWPSTFRVCW